jgi:DNA-binding NarL/FixJ family response regulator
MVAQKRAANPDLTKDEVKKLKSIELKNARARTGAGKTAIRIEDAEWDAIQAGAISNSKLSKILDHADLDRVKELATPKSQLLMTTAKKQRALTMLAAGYTQAEVAQALGVSVSTLKNNISGE